MIDGKLHGYGETCQYAKNNIELAITILHQELEASRGVCGSRYALAVLYSLSAGLCISHRSYSFANAKPCLPVQHKELAGVSNCHPCNRVVQYRQPQLVQEKASMPTGLGRRTLRRGRDIFFIKEHPY